MLILQRIGDGLLYALPDCVLRSGTLKKLHLKSCELNLTGCVRLGSLTSLFLEDILLGDDIVERLTSCFPVLSELVIADCNTDRDLKVFVRNSMVRSSVLCLNLIRVCINNKLSKNLLEYAVINYT